MNMETAFSIGDELSIRLLGYQVPYQLLAKVVGIVDYATAQEKSDVDTLYYNRKSDLSDQQMTDRVKQLYYQLVVTNPLNTTFKENHVLYVSKDLYDPNLTTKSIESEDYKISLRITKDVVGASTETAESVMAEIQELIAGKPGVSISVESLGSTDVTVDPFEVKLEKLQAIADMLTTLDADVLKDFTNFPFSDMISSLNDASRNTTDAALSLQNVLELNNTPS